MSTHKITIDLGERSHALTVAGAMTDLLQPPPDAQTLFEADRHWRVEAYFDHVVDVARLTEWLIDETRLPNLSLTLSTVPDLNWVAISQAALPPVIAGRFIIHGEHDRGRITRSTNTIEISAGEAFGTAHHATTRGCLDAIDRLARATAPRTVLDLGCGTAVLALAARRAFPHAEVYASDIDPVAVAVARDNARLNGARFRIRVQCAAGIVRVPGTTFDLVIANILAGPLIDLASRLTTSLRPCAVLVLSGILVSEARRVTAKYVAAGFSIVRHTQDAGWSTLTMTRSTGRPSHYRPAARSDGLRHIPKRSKRPQPTGSEPISTSAAHRRTV
jgi:ribosomal protein L11 methyltransferase